MYVINCFNNSRRKDINILVAEDEKDIREVICKYLEAGDYEIYSAENGVKAWKIFNEIKIDLVVLDIIMPYLDGFNLLKRIRETSKVPAIFLTARGDILIPLMKKIMQKYL